MKKIVIASALIFSALFACQKPIELNEIVNSKPNSSRISDEGKGMQEFYYSANLVAIRDKDKDMVSAKIFEEFPEANELYDSYVGRKVKLTFISAPFSLVSYNNQQTFGFSGVRADPVTILDSVLNRFKVDCSRSDTRIQCIEPSKMENQINEAFAEAGYKILRTTVSEKGNIVLVIDNSPTQSSPITLASCIATIIQYFN